MLPFFRSNFHQFALPNTKHALLLSSNRCIVSLFALWSLKFLLAASCSRHFTDCFSLYGITLTWIVLLKKCTENRKHNYSKQNRHKFISICKTKQNIICGLSKSTIPTVESWIWYLWLTKRKESSINSNTRTEPEGIHYISITLMIQPLFITTKYIHSEVMFDT